MSLRSTRSNPRAAPPPPPIVLPPTSLSVTEDYGESSNPFAAIDANASVQQLSGVSDGNAVCENTPTGSE